MSVHEVMLAMARIGCGRLKCCICIRCGKEFEYLYKTGRVRLSCDECRPILIREQKNRILHKYYQSPEGKTANTMSCAKYRQSQKGKTVKARIMRKYYRTPEGRAACDKSWAAYYQSPKGKAAIARLLAKRRERSTSPELYAARVELLHIAREPCAKCGVPYRISHQIDHIIPLCLGGTDNWDNLWPLCAQCHREKTGRDLHEYRKRLSGTTSTEVIKKDPDRLVKV